MQISSFIGKSNFLSCLSIVFSEVYILKKYIYQCLTVSLWSMCLGSKKYFGRKRGNNYGKA
ncbi:MAG: hypothetical protein BWY74_04032 [Firmicutes bacterium ADurb.Bin419]|nr:MAG: hypothetical protein BWY74_04032 [Firmicutes bacterium ADurb.Bin419]